MQHQRFDSQVMLTVIVPLVVLVAVIQLGGIDWRGV
jgi:ABC-type methionine transport system permease subunit